MKQVKKPFNIVATLIFLIAITILTIAFSSWLITDEIKEKPTYQSGTVAKYYLDNQTTVYNGQPQAPTSSLFKDTDLNYEYKISTDATYTSGKPVNAGEYDVLVTIKDNNETVEVKYSITPKPLDDSFVITLSKDKFLQTGSAITPDVTIKDNDITLIKETDYTLTYENNIYSGDANIIITGQNNYQGTLNKTFRIVATAQLEVLCESNQEFTYNGKSQTPEYRVMYDSDTITDATVKIEYKLLGDASYLEGAPTNYGTYWIKIVAQKEGYDSSDAIEVLMKINSKEITITWEKLNLVYNKTEQCPTASSADLENDGTTIVVSGKQINAGTYTATAEIYGGNSGNYTIKSGESSSFTIKPATLTLNKYLIEKDYDTSKRTWSAVQPLISSELSLKGILSGDTVTFSVSGMNDGTFGYGEDAKLTGINNNDITGITSYTNIVGSTYSVSLSLDNDNYTLSADNPIIFKYKSAIVNGTYYTIEDAINLTTDDITFKGDATSFVYSAFSNLASSINPYYKNYNEYLVSSRKLIISCQSTVTDDSSRYLGFDSGSETVYSALYIPQCVSIKFMQSSKLLADGKIRYGYIKNVMNTTIVAQHGVLYNNGDISIANGCTLDSYGYIKGFGQINVASGAIVTDCMHTYDWPGGKNAFLNYTKIIPTNSWSFHNISCKIVVYSGAIYNGLVYAVVSGSDGIYTVTTLIGKESTENCLFKIKSGYVIKETKPATNWTEDSNEYKSLYLLTGSNQIAGQRDIITVYGHCEDSTLKISLSYSGFPMNMETSTSKAAPMGYIDLILEEDSKLDLNKSDYLFLPGSKLIIKKGAELTTSSGVDIIMGKWADFETHTNSNSGFATKCVDQIDAQAWIYGTAIINGNIGGYWGAGEQGAVLNISSGKTSASYKVLHSSDSSNDDVCVSNTVNGIGNVDGTENTNLSSKAYISVNNNGTYCWTEATNVTEFTLNFYDKDTLLETKHIFVVDGTTYTVEGSEYKPTKKYYSFVEWTLDKEGNNKLTSENGKLVKDTNNTITLYAQWELRKYNFSYTAGYGESNAGEVNYISIDNLENAKNLITEFTIDDFKNDELVLYKDVKYYVDGSLKYFEGWYVGTDKSSGVLIDKITIKNLDDFIEQYGESCAIPLFCNFVDTKSIEVTYSTAIGSLEKTKDILSTKGEITLPDINEDTYTNYQYNREYPKYFIGWQINGTGTIYNVGQSVNVTEDTEFIAVWSDKYTLTFNLDGGEFESTASDTTYYYSPSEIVDISKFEKPVKEHFNFVSWSETNAKITNKGLEFTDDSKNGVTLTANYSEITYTITINNKTGYDITKLIVYFQNNTELYETSYTYSNTISKNSQITLPYSYREGTTFKISITVSEKDYNLKLDGNYIGTLNESKTYEVSRDACIVKGSKITLYDGTQKNIEDINADDILLVFNHITGQFDGAPASYVIHKHNIETVYRVINLKFSNGKEVGIVGEHGFYDVDLNKYIYINENNIEEFIGHSFAYTDDIENMITTTLIGYEVVEQLTSIYSPITYSYLNCFVDGILTITNFSDGFINMFEFADDMKYDAEKMQADIEKYGLYTYEDFAEYATLEQFNAFNAQYLKVSVGKCLITYDELINLLKTFLSEENKLN